MRRSGYRGPRSSSAILLLLTGILCSSALTANEAGPSNLLYDAPGTPGVTVRLVPSQATIQPGDPLEIDIVISGLGDGASPSLGSFDLNVTWDDTLFTYDSLTFGSALGDLAMAEAIGDSVPLATSVQAFEVSLLPAATLNTTQMASFTLATVAFDGTGILGDGQFDVGGLLSDENGVALAFAAEGTLVSAGTVLDIPTAGDFALLLMMLGLCVTGVIVLRRVS